MRGTSGDLLLTFIQLHSNDEAGMDMMALAIYGLVIFPKADGYVDGRVIYILYQLKHGVNPIPVFLAELRNKSLFYSSSPQNPSNEPKPRPKFNLHHVNATS